MTLTQAERDARRRYDEVAADAIAFKHRADTAEAALAQAEARLAELAAQKPATLRQQILELRKALQGVIRVADRKTDEFDVARAALARTEANHG